MASPTVHQRPRQNSEVDPFSDPDVYYGDEKYLTQGALGRGRSMSTTQNKLDISTLQNWADELHSQPRKFVICVDEMLDSLLRLEDTDNNMQITIDDRGPKVVTVGTATSSGFNRRDVRGTYMLSNLLQELTLARDHGRKYVILDEQRLNENPVSRLSRLIKVSYWNALTRRLDGSNIGVVGRDPKDWTGHPVPRIYVPADCPEQLDYYAHVAASKPELELEVITLPSAQDITPEFVRDLNNRPGILALAMHEKEEDGKRTLEGVSYVVPGGRFNELYGWDGYMESIGLMLSGRVDLARGMIENYVFCIQHYGKILNANRSYYLCRSQPPFLTDMTFKVADALAKEAAKKEDSSAATAAAADATNFFRIAILAAIKEYYSVWTALPRLDLVSGLSRYRPDGIGIPPETEPMHFFHLLMPRARARGLNMQQFAEGYNSGALKDQELDEYFLHDRAVRESGHDTSYRLERVAADLATVDLNSLLYKYETDIATAIRDRFGGSLRVPVEFQVSDKVNPAAAGHEEETAVTWEARAAARKSAMDRLMWDETAGMYFDYNTVTRKHTGYESATTFWTMWSGVASNAQAARLVSDALPRFRALGGLVAGTEASRGAVGLDRPSRQWDYPYGWAPQQILAWGGLARYGYTNEAAELAYRWLYMVIKAFVDFNGTVVEKYDVTRGVDPHRVDAEYGNQGSDFRGVSREGFGWVNASFVYGLEMVTPHMRRALGTCTPFETFRRAVLAGEYGDSAVVNDEDVEEWKKGAADAIAEESEEEEEDKQEAHCEKGAAATE